MRPPGRKSGGCSGVDNARVVTRDFRGMLNADFVAEAGADTPIALPPKRDTVGYGPFTQDYQTSYFLK